MSAETGAASPTPSDTPKRANKSDTPKRANKNEAKPTSASSGPRSSSEPAPKAEEPSAADDSQRASETQDKDVAADNTKRNRRDRSSGALTPTDQGNDAASLKVTRQIRQALMADNSLSFTAKNVKIITQNGKVTLRGPVKTTGERDRIEAAARKVAGDLQIDNQIEVKQ